MRRERDVNRDTLAAVYRRDLPATEEEFVRRAAEGPTFSDLLRDLGVEDRP